MKKMLTTILTFALATTSFAKTHTSHEINFSDLILLYMQNKNDDSTMLDWNTGSQKTSPIIWKHSGVTECDEQTEKSLGTPFCRTGEVVITDKGKPISEVLEKKVEPGKWQITLAGIANGFFYVTIESEILGAELPLTKINTLSISKYKCGGEKPSSQGNQVYKITMAGKKQIYLNESWFCGAKNCTSNYIIYYNKVDADKIRCIITDNN